MKLALIGYGKMGHIIEQIARSRGHEIVKIIDIDNNADIESADFATADVAIEFTTPHTAADNCTRALKAGVNVVSGSTGWADKLPEVEKLAESLGRGMMWSSNFSIGVNIFMALNRYLARVMNKFHQYVPDMTETHHVHKLDHPSGTAVTLAEGIIAENDRIDRWVEEAPAAEDAMIVSHIRRAEVPGIHEITWESPIDSISIKHSAKTREGFALGAVMAAEWLASRTGVHSMDEMMHELISSDDTQR